MENKIKFYQRIVLLIRFIVTDVSHAHTRYIRIMWVSSASSRTFLGTDKMSHLPKLQFGKALWMTIKEFLNSSTLHGYRYMVEEKRFWLEKFMWFVINIINFIFAGYVVLNIWFGYTDNPTFITLATQQIPTWELAFPAIAICNINKISLEKITNYSSYLESKIAMAQINQQFILERLQYLGRLYDFDIEGREDMVWIQEVLDRFDVDDDMEFYDVDANMLNISPSCDEILVKCRWGGQDYNCTDLFQRRKTAEGFCCIFNYGRLKDSDNETTKYIIRKSDFSGPDLGLVTVVNASTSDYFYPLKNLQGFNVYVFNNYNYPDGSTGSLHMETVGLAYEAFLRLGVEILQSVQEVHSFSSKQRQCLFSDELYEQYAGRYSYSECLVKCKVRSIIALCKCIPFQYPSNYADRIGDGIVKCSLQHITCLNRYRTKWRTYRPPDDTDKMGLEGELEDSLSCPDCLPQCSSIIYSVSASGAPISNVKNREPRRDLLFDIPDITNLSVIRIYFPSSDTQLYRRDVIFTWYEILSSFGGILSLCMGFSIVSAIELLYFLTIRYYHNLIKISNPQIAEISTTESIQKKFNELKRKKMNYRDIEMRLNNEHFYYLK